MLAKQTILVGTIRSNRRELPKLAKIAKDKMECFSTIIYKSNNCTLTIYKTKPSKIVIILSTKHKYVKINNDRKRISETVAYYNKTKFGINITDQMARKYSVKSNPTDGLWKYSSTSLIWLVSMHGSFIKKQVE